MDRGSRRRRRRLIEATWVGGIVLLSAGVAVALDPIETTKNDFFTAGTQPNTIVAGLAPANDLCIFCHADENEDGDVGDLAKPYEGWHASMHGQAARDPVFHAAVAIANQDAENAGELCLRCHAPMGWYQGRSDAPDGSSLIPSDLEGVSCIVCHRAVDPEITPDDAPPAMPWGPGNNPTDPQILGDILLPDGVPSHGPHNGSLVLDPYDNRRGPFDLDADWGGFFPFHSFRESPFHRTARMCAACHDVSNPAFTKQPDGTYALNALDTPGPSNKYEQKAEQRTFSEWAQSAFALGPIDPAGDGRFGGTMTAVSTCQDCHMPQLTGQDCAIDPPVRPDLKMHTWNGANSWVLRAIDSIYPRQDVFNGTTGELETVGTRLGDGEIDAAEARTKQMLADASDLELFVNNSTMTARVINYTGHKLPTGYPEGRRMWVNVKYFDRGGTQISELGAYDEGTQTLDESGTKVYEVKAGIDQAVSNVTGIPVGETFHLVLNNVVLFDNRIPPMGFTNANFEAVQAAPVGYAYPDGQHWDDTDYSIPAGAYRAEVRVLYQTTTREYIEFLRDNALDGSGTIAYNLWVAFDGDQRCEMDFAQTTFTDCPCDWNVDGNLNDQDFFDFVNAFFDAGTSHDYNADGNSNDQDWFDFVNCFFGPPLECN